MKQPFEPSQHVKEYLQGVVGVVEATHFERTCLWQQNKFLGQNAFAWETESQGFGCMVGKCERKPIWVSLMTATVDGQKLLFVEPTSRVVDWTKIENWLLEWMPETAFQNGRLNKVYAEHFHNVFPTSPPS